MSGGGNQSSGTPSSETQWQFVKTDSLTCCCSKIDMISPSCCLGNMGMILLFENKMQQWWMYPTLDKNKILIQMSLPL